MDDTNVRFYANGVLRIFDRESYNLPFCLVYSENGHVRAFMISLKKSQFDRLFIFWNECLREN
jgi:hypothetical protein